MVRLGSLLRAAGVLLAVSLGCSQAQEHPYSSYGAGLAVVVGDVDGDGTDDVVAPMGSDLVAVDGVSLEQLWRRPNGDGRKVATKRFLVLSNQRAVEVAALADGAVTGTVPLTDRVDLLTVDGEAVWVRTIDGKVGKLDPSTRVLDAAAGPPPAPRASVCPSGLSPCEPLADADFRLRDGTLAVSFQFKKQGTKELTIIGEDGGATTFTRLVDPNGHGLRGADLAGGVVYLSLADKLLAVDARSGSTVFELAGRPGPLYVASGRLYVETEAMKTYKALEVLDARTGAAFFVLGSPLRPLHAG